MKNKKLIATVASLCLVLVAVVAAVVGVLAASQQKVSNHISINYSANDVYATVSATAWTEENSTVQNLMPQDESGYAADYTFYRTTAETTKSAKLVDVELTSANKYVVYKLVFTNNMTGYALNVAGAFTAATNAAQNYNARLFVKNVDTAPVPTYNQSTGKLSNATELGEELTNDKAALTSITSVVAATETSGTLAPASDTIFLILCIDDLNVPAAYLLGQKESATGAQLIFTLTRGTKVGA